MEPRGFKDEWPLRYLTKIGPESFNSLCLPVRLASQLGLRLLMKLCACFEPRNLDQRR
jgi:hypothetical protein